MRGACMELCAVYLQKKWLGAPSRWWRTHLKAPRDETSKLNFCLELLQNTKPQSSLKTLPGSRARQSALTFWSGGLAPFPSQPTLKKKYIQKGKTRQEARKSLHMLCLFSLIAQSTLDSKASAPLVIVRYCSLPVVVEEKISCKSSFVAVTQIWLTSLLSLSSAVVCVSWPAEIERRGRADGIIASRNIVFRGFGVYVKRDWAAFSNSATLEHIFGKCKWKMKTPASWKHKAEMIEKRELLI